MRALRLGFQTVGHGTLICHDGGPVLATHPWISGASSFGLALAPPVSPTHRAVIEACPFLWIADDSDVLLHEPSLRALSRRGRQVLVPNHAGAGPAERLRRLGFVPRVLPSHEWVRLSPRLHVRSMPDPTQQAILLIDLDGRLLVEANHAADWGNGAVLRAEIARRETSFLLASGGQGHLPIQVVDDLGHPIPPRRTPGPLGGEVEGILDGLRPTYFVPIARMARHVRPDAQWALPFSLPPLAHHDRFWLADHMVLPPFLQWNFETKGVFALEPALSEPTDYGPLPNDPWDEPLNRSEVLEVRRFLDELVVWSRPLREVAIVVAGSATRVRWAEGGPPSMVIHAPRRSLLKAVRNRRLGDLLRAGFVRVHLRGLAPHEDPHQLLNDLLLPLLRLAESARVRSTTDLLGFPHLLPASMRRSFLRCGKKGGALMRAMGIAPELGCPAS